MITPIETGSCSMPRLNSPKSSNGCEKKWINGPRQRGKKKSAGWKNPSSSARAMNGCFGRWRGTKKNGRCEWDRPGLGGSLCSQPQSAVDRSRLRLHLAPKTCNTSAPRRCCFGHSSPLPTAAVAAQQERYPNGALIMLREPPSPGPRIGHRPRGGESEERSFPEGRQQGRSIARATRGLRRPSLDARSLAQPCCLPEKSTGDQREREIMRLQASAIRQVTTG